jgi:hypothetical protein
MPNTVLTPPDQSLRLHRAVAARLVADPAGVLAAAAANLARLRSTHPDAAAAQRLDRWGATLDAGAEAVLDMLVSRDPLATDLREHSPFVDILADGERRAVLAACADA